VTAATRYAGPRDRLGRPLPAGSSDALEAFEQQLTDRGPDELTELGARLFDERRFFEAHEAFERVWKSDETSPDDRALWKAVTQVAAGFCHMQRGNRKGAASVLEKAARALDRCPAMHRGADTRALASAARRIARSASIGPTDFPKFPRTG